MVNPPVWQVSICQDNFSLPMSMRAMGRCYLEGGLTVWDWTTQGTWNLRKSWGIWLLCLGGIWPQDTVKERERVWCGLAEEFNQPHDLEGKGLFFGELTLSGLSSFTAWVSFRKQSTKPTASGLFRFHITLFEREVCVQGGFGTELPLSHKKKNKESQLRELLDPQWKYLQRRHPQEEIY
jgi:hypothetical protein